MAAQVLDWRERNKSTNQNTNIGSINKRHNN